MGKKMINSNKLELIPEKFSYIIIIPLGNGEYLLEDQLRKKQFRINKTAYDICVKIDGINTLGDISSQICREYNIPIEQAQNDVINLYNFLKKNKLVLTKNNFLYKYIKFYYFITGISEGE